MPEDANDVRDVYEWRVQGATGCTRLDGCISLISSGQSDKDSFLTGMSDDGHDVFFFTNAQLVPGDIPGSQSIYDARIGGGFAALAAQTPCQGDACQGSGSPPPALPSPGSAGFSGEGNVPPEKAKKKKQRKHKKKAHAKKKAHKKAAKKGHKHQRANADRRNAR